MLPEQTDGTSFLNTCAANPSGGHPSASGKKHTLSFRLDAATSAIVHCSHNQIQIGHYRQHDMRCLPHVLVTLMQIMLCLRFFPSARRGPDVCIYFDGTGDDQTRLTSLTRSFSIRPRKNCLQRFRNSPHSLILVFRDPRPKRHTFSSHRGAR